MKNIKYRKNKVAILFFDIEISPMVATTWDLYPKYLSIDNIIKDWYMISAAWKWQGEKTVHAVSAKKPWDDKNVVKALRDELQKADFVVAHNGDKFDIKKFNSRVIYHKLDPIKKPVTVDTLKEVKRVATFSSNKLDYLSKILNGKRKLHTEYDLWMDAIKGDKEAIRKMVAYNKVDVIRLEELYDRLLPYMDRHPHVGVLKGNDRHLSCQTCGSNNVIKRGIRVSAAGIKTQDLQCHDCHHYSRVPFR